MTAIVGIRVGRRVIIGGDSAGTDAAFGQTVRSDPKVFRNGEFLLGFTSSFRMGQLLHYRLVTPVPERWELQRPEHLASDMLGFMSTRFIDAVRACLKQYGWASKTNETECGGEFLVGWRGHLYSISSDYQVGESLEAYDAVGSGSDLCLGAMFALEGTDMPIQLRIERALEAAAQFNASVRPPFHIEEV